MPSSGRLERQVEIPCWIKAAASSAPPTKTAGISDTLLTKSVASDNPEGTDNALSFDYLGPRASDSAQRVSPADPAQAWRSIDHPAGRGIGADPEHVLDASSGSATCFDRAKRTEHGWSVIAVTANCPTMGKMSFSGRLRTQTHLPKTREASDRQAIPSPRVRTCSRDRRCTIHRDVVMRARDLHRTEGWPRRCSLLSCVIQTDLRVQPEG